MARGRPHHACPGRNCCQEIDRRRVRRIGCQPSAEPYWAWPRAVELVNHLSQPGCRWAMIRRLRSTRSVKERFHGLFAECKRTNAYGGRTGRHAPAVGVARRSEAEGDEVRLRRRTMRRLHGPGQWDGDA